MNKNILLILSLLCLSALSGEAFISNNFQTIDSNIFGATAEDKFSQARVIILLEKHALGGGQLPNAALLNRYWKKGDQLLTEGLDVENLGTPCTVCLLDDTEIAKQHESWDLDKENLVNSSFSLFFGQIGLSINLLEKLCSESMLMHMPHLQVTTEYEDELRRLTGVEDIAERSFEERYEYLHGLIPVMLKNFETVAKMMIQETYGTFFERNAHMALKICESLEHYSRVWVIAGASHGQSITPETKEGVKFLYDSLQEKSIPYITLYATEAGEEELENVHLQRYADETHMLSTPKQWAEWITTRMSEEINTLATGMQQNGYSVLQNFHYFIEFSLINILEGEVLLTDFDPNLARHHVGRNQ